MSLQARLRHSLGERWIELPERGVESPLTVGRAATCDVQVPSVTVAQRHSVLFVHEGRWVVQDVSGDADGATHVNGRKLDAPAFLNVGDVISLGQPGAPSLEVDPGGVEEGRRGQPIAAVDLPPAASGSGHAAPIPAAAGLAAPVPPAHPLYPPQYPPQYPGYPAGYAPAPWAQQHPPAPAPPAPGDVGMIDWPAEAAPRYYGPPRRRKSSDGSTGVIIGMVLTLLITAGTGYWVYSRREKPVVVVTAPAPAASQPARSPSYARADQEAAHAPPSIFSNTDPRGPARAATRPSTRAAASPAVSRTTPASPAPAVADGTPMSAAPGSAQPDAGSAASTTTGAPSEDSATTTPSQNPGDDPAWKQVEAARYLKDEGKAILQFDDYARTHPGVATDKLQEYTEKMLDRIWLERVENLCEQREELNKKIQETDKDLAEETDQSYKSRVLVPLKQQYQTRLQNIEEELMQNMKYEGKATPNLLDDDAVEKLRKSRDPQYYASWKGRVLSHVRRTHGELPWVATKSR